MVIVTVDDTGVVTGYEVATLRVYRQLHGNDTTKHFVDRTAFLNDVDIAHFMNYPSKYGVIRGTFQRIEI